MELINKDHISYFHCHKCLCAASIFSENVTELKCCRCSCLMEKGLFPSSQIDELVLIIDEVEDQCVGSFFMPLPEPPESDKALSDKTIAVLKETATPFIEDGKTPSDQPISDYNFITMNDPSKAD